MAKLLNTGVGRLSFGNEKFNLFAITLHFFYCSDFCVYSMVNTDVWCQHKTTTAFLTHLY